MFGIPDLRRARVTVLQNVARRVANFGLGMLSKGVEDGPDLCS